MEAARAQAEATRHQLADLESGARPEEIAQAEAAVAAAEATAVRARVERARQAALLAEGAVAQRSVEEADEAAAQAEASVKRARAVLALLRNGNRPEEIAAARARFRAAEGQVAVAEAQLAGLAAEERGVDEAAAGIRAAAAALAEARSAAIRQEALDHEARAAASRIDQAAAGVRQARADLAERTIVAPFAGWIGRRFVDPGDLASPSQPLFSVVEAGHAWVTAEVDAQDLAPVRPGQPVSLTVPAYPGRVFPGLVAQVGAQAFPQTEVRTSARMVRVRISVRPTPAPDRSLLKPGMEVDVAGESVLVPQAIQVPNDAILTDATGTYVFTVVSGRASGHGRIARRRVKTGYAGARETQILSGLSAGEQVVVSGKEGLAEGMRATATPRP